MPKQKHTSTNNDNIGKNMEDNLLANIQVCANEILDLMDMIEWRGKGSYRRILKLAGVKESPNSIRLLYKKNPSFKNC